MSTEMTIPDHYQIKYGNEWMSKLQQKKDRLGQHVTIKNGCAGRYTTIEQIDPIDLDEKTARFEKVQLEDVKTSRRFMFPKTFTKSVGFDEDDGWKLNSISVPVMESAQQLYYGAQRKMEDVLIEGINGVNTVGDGYAEAMTTVALPASQIVPVNYVETGAATNTPLTIAKLRSALEKLQTSEAFGQDTPDSNTCVCAVSARDLNHLLRDDAITNTDYAEVKALVRGEVDTALGFRFIRTERLPNAAGIRSVLCFVKSQVYFGIWDGYKSKLSIRDDLSEATQYRVHASFGATRLQEEGVVRIEADSTL